MDRTTIKKLIEELSSFFVGRDEEAKIAVLALVTKNHCVLLGPPGVGKSAILGKLSEAISGNYNYYLMGKYTIPDELIGPIDPIEYKNGKFRRLLTGRLPEANIAFIDEVFKGSSETLNTLLNIMNERKFIDVDGTQHNVPLISMFAASNELPQSDDLQAFYDRILIKHFVKPVDSDSLEKGLLLNLTNNKSSINTKITLMELEQFRNDVVDFMKKNAAEISTVISQVVVVMKSQGVIISDRTAMNPNYLPILIAAYSFIYDLDFKKSAIAMSKYVLQNNEEQMDAYAKALDNFYPPELRAAQEKLQKADDLLANLNLKDAREAASQAIEQAQSLMEKPETMDLYKEDIMDLMNRADRIIYQVKSTSEQISSMKVKA